MDNKKRLYRKLHFSEYHPAPNNWIFGGASPIGNLYNISNPDVALMHFLTIPFLSGQLSIFLNFDYRDRNANNPFYSGCKLFSVQDNMVRFIMHSCKNIEGQYSEQRGNALPLKRLVPSFMETIDCPYDEFDAYPFHKLGGMPVFKNHFDSKFEAQCQSLMDSHQHFLQIAFPVGPDDCLIDTDWPFGEMIFHVFVDMNSKTNRFKYCWG
jgi:hypothetical protein